MADDTALIRLGAEMEAARHRSGMSAQAVAQRAGISSAYLRALERGKNPKTQRPSRPKPEALRGIARTLGKEAKPWLELAGYSARDAERTPGPTRGGVEYNARIIQESVKRLTQRGPFMYARAAEILQRAALDLNLASSGTIMCGPDEEPRFTTLAVQECQSYLRAVSYQDDAWWFGEGDERYLGDRYLDLHEELREKNVNMTRIFLVDRREDSRLGPTLRRHVELGINTYVVDKGLVSDRYWRDFVVYDEKVLRTAAVADLDNRRKLAEFTDDQGRIDSALADFEDLLHIAAGAGSEAAVVLNRLAEEAAMSPVTDVETEPGTGES